jgi:hypothetical protein
MSETAYVTLTCPHCAKPLRASPADAGGKVHCSNPDCLRPVSVPPAPEDEPDEPVLLPEDPVAPQTVPVAAAPTLPAAPRAKPAPIPAPPPKPRPEESEPPQRTPLLPWVLAAFACMVASGAITGWVMTATREKPASASAEAVAAFETKNRDLRAENQKLRDQLEAAKPVAPAPAPKEPEKPAAPEIKDPPPPVRRNADPPAKPPEEPKPPPNKPDPPAKPAQARDAFVGMWSVNDPQLKALQAEATFEFRADGTSGIEIRIAGMEQGLTGTWRWDRRRLHMEIEGIPGGKPAEVKWNGADEFIATADNMPVTFRRKR